MKRLSTPYTVTESHTPPPYYDRAPEFDADEMVQERDVLVPMRDGVRLAVDVYRPNTPGKLPALLSIARHNKDMQSPDACENSGPAPAWAPLWIGGQEGGDTRFFVSRGYVHIIGNARGIAKSEGGGSPQWDYYDLIEWIAAQPWCDGKVGMTGISNFAGQQWVAAKLQPPHLVAIFPYDAFPAYPFPDRYPGGMVHLMPFFLEGLAVEHVNRGVPGPLPPEQEELWREAMNNADYRMYGHLYNILTQRGQHTPMTYSLLLNPYDTEANQKRVDADFEKIKVPVYTGAGWYAYTYKGHLNGAQQWYEHIDVPKKMLFTGVAHLPRPFHSFHHEILRWYDYWLKGIDTGIMNEPPVKMWVEGANAWYSAEDWPLPETKWTKYYLESWERLREEPYTPSSREGMQAPDAFVQMPLSQTRKVQKLRYMTAPLPEDTMMAGPAALYLYAAIDQEDTNWIIVLKDVGPDESVQTAREGEYEVPDDLPEREIVRGWLKASHRALDPARSKPWKPWHPLTREAQKAVVPGEICEYAIEILASANMFKRGHRICVEITSMDVPTGVAGFTNAEYISYHICSSKTTVHKVYHDEKHPSHLLLPIVPKAAVH